ncbi:emp24p/erv25p- protein [Allomyces arbusculus]|nr:emp24p/erv25p- protein [Allomyces arbusculus]
MRPLLFAVVVLLACLAATAQGLHFYLENGKEKCFFEELPKDTVVMGTYSSEEWSDANQQYIENLALNIAIKVTHVESGVDVVSKKGASFGKFSFSAAYSGQHKLCVTPSTATWFSFAKTRMHLDLVIGDNASAEEPKPEDKANDMVIRVRDLIHRVADIRREQQYQREVEATFRDTSELINSRVVTWTIVQLCALGLTCFWQLRHLRTFFAAKKLV